MNELRESTRSRPPVDGGGEGGREGWVAEGTKGVVSMM